MTTLRPFALVAELTYRCPLKCPFCSNPLELANYRNELDTDTWCRVFSEAAELGVVQLHLSGGEPLVRGDLDTLIRSAREHDLYSNLSTSAATVDEARLKALYDAGLDALQVSLLDSDATSNDLLAGTPSFHKKQQAVRAARDIGFPVTINTVLHRHNLDRISEIIELAISWDVDKLELAHTQYVGWAFRNRAALLPTRQQVAECADVVDEARERIQSEQEGRPQILHVLPDYFQDWPKACLSGWGRVFLSVAPDGYVLPCQTAREIPELEFANIRDQSLADIWFNDPCFRRFRGTEWMPEPCQSCDRREVDFGGCRCQAFLLTGDVAATDPVCQLSPLHHLVTDAVSETERLGKTAPAADAPAQLAYRMMRSDG